MSRTDNKRLAELEIKAVARRLETDQKLGEVIFQVIRATLEDLGINETPEVRATLAKHLRAVE